MKTLYLLRHGHAESKAKQPDVERNLDAEGRSEAERIGEKLKKIDPLPQLIISSHAKRAFQTAEIAALALDYNIKNILIEECIYRTDEETILEVVQRQDDKYDIILLAGHNPHISELATDLSNKEFNDSMHTAGIVGVSSDVMSWAEFSSANTKLIISLEP
jgi:phosphohistidine phosphatase